MKFLDLEFTPVTMEHKNRINKILKLYPQKISLYTFASLISWSQVNFYSIHFYSDDLLFIKYGEKHLVQPIGNFTVEAQKFLLSKINFPLEMHVVSDEFMAQNEAFCSHFDDINDRNFANYIYKAEDLAKLNHRYYSSKRNLIHQAESLYNWSVMPITSDCHPYCLKILLDGKPQNDPLMQQELDKELAALNFLLDHFQELDQKGFVIAVDDKPVAFSICEELNPNTMIIHFEKALGGYKGLFQVINNETAKAIYAQGYEFINREEDLGFEGLRKAKMSYHPIELIPSHILIYRSELS